MAVLWATGLQPRPQVDRRFLAALLPVALFHTIGHVSACVSFSQVSEGGVARGDGCCQQACCLDMHAPQITLSTHTLP